MANALAAQLPDILDFNGLNIACYVWLGYLRPLGALTKPELIDKLLPTIKLQRAYPVDHKLYSIATFDSGLVLWGNKKLLRRAGGLPRLWTKLGR